MELEFRQLLPNDFSPASRVWIYPCHRLFSLSEAVQVEDMLRNFVSTWESHGDPVKGYGNLFYGRFVVLMADESATGVSGCSTDSSVRLIKQLESQLGVTLFDRQSLHFFVNGKIEQIPLAQAAYALEQGFITPDTLYFDHTVQTKAAMESRWLVPVKESWLARKIMPDRSAIS